MIQILIMCGPGIGEIKDTTIMKDIEWLRVKKQNPNLPTSQENFTNHLNTHSPYLRLDPSEYEGQEMGFGQGQRES